MALPHQRPSQEFNKCRESVRFGFVYLPTAEAQPFESSCVPAAAETSTDACAVLFLDENDAAGIVIVPSAAVVTGAGGAGDAANLASS